MRMIAALVLVGASLGAVGQQGTTASGAAVVAPVAPTAAPAQVAKPKPLVGAIAGRPEWPLAKAEDVKTVQAIVASLYSVISGGKGVARDWDRFKSLFVPGARLVPIRMARGSGHNDPIFLSPEDYIERSSGALNEGFVESSVANRVEEFGNIVHVWSTYESRHEAGGAAFARGINSIQLVKDGERYWIVQVMWDAERPGVVIPEKYLK